MSVSQRPKAAPTKRRTASLLRQLRRLEDSGGAGQLDFGAGRTLNVSSLDKIYFPDGRSPYTKGDVMRYYVTVAPVLLPLVADRPLVLKRYPDGIRGPSFFQQNAGPSTPRSVRTVKLTAGGRRASRFVGGDLLTLLYTVQIGTIAVHSWQARARTPDVADTTTIDLDPGDDVPFRDVVRLARGVKAELDKVGLLGAVKTSGSSGLHIVLPMPPRTSFATASAVAEAIADRVVAAFPALATLERALAARPPGTIYVDAQQNAKGKTVVAAYSLRERPSATVSAPLDWPELRSTLRLEAFTLASMPARLRRLGDVWGVAMKRANTTRTLERLLEEGRR